MSIGVLEPVAGVYHPTNPVQLAEWVYRVSSWVWTWACPAMDALETQNIILDLGRGLAFLDPRLRSPVELQRERAPAPGALT